jgi:hypothetical protein
VFPFLSDRLTVVFVSTHKHAADDGSRRLRWGVGRRGDDPTVQLAVVIGLVVGMLVMALIWVAVASRDGHGTGALHQPRSPVSNADATVLGTEASAPVAGAVPAGLVACRQVTADIARPLQAARRTLDRWSVHVGAMNRLMAGKISPAQAKTYWTQSRLGAAGDVHRFHVVDHRFHHAHAARCPRPTAVTGATVKACATAAAADEQALSAAETAIHTWARHIHDMEALRAGKLDPGMAAQMWLANWHKGVRQIHAWDAAARGAGQVSC